MPIPVADYSRYLLRPAVAQDRLRLLADGRVVLTLKTAWADGTRHLIFEPSRCSRNSGHSRRGRGSAAETRAAQIGEVLADVRLQSSATWALGGIHALAGDARAGIDACRRGLTLSPDPLGRAIAQAWLGYATLEAGDLAEAVTLLEQGVERFGRFRFRAHGWFTAWLAEAHLAAGRPAEAQELARRAGGVRGSARNLRGARRHGVRGARRRRARRPGLSFDRSIDHRRSTCG